MSAWDRIGADGFAQWEQYHNTKTYTLPDLIQTVKQILNGDPGWAQKKVLASIFVKQRVFGRAKVGSPLSKTHDPSTPDLTSGAAAYRSTPQSTL